MIEAAVSCKLSFLYPLFLTNFW